MNNEWFLFQLISNALVIGVGATLVMDIWALLLKYIFSITPLNYALVGRWLGYMPKGVFYHCNINSVKPMAMEALIGWLAHYLIGIIFALVFIFFMDASWLIEPTIAPAIVFGVLTVVFPFFLMQPGLGLGVAAAKTPHPGIARWRSILTHIIFGLGIYWFALINSFFISA